jgi:hypothetical protein
MPDKIIVSAPGPQGPAGVGGGGGVTDGDKGDLTVSGGGTVYTIDAGVISTAKVADGAISTAKIADDAVTFDKIANVTGPALLGRQAATSGSAEAITLGTGLSIDGSKQLTITAAYAQQSLTMTAGTGLTGGGDLSASRTFAVSYGTSAGTACQGNDSRLSDARTPNAHTHALADIQQGGATSGQVLEWSGSAWAPATLSGGGGGTVTSVTAGDGLLGGTITASGTIDCNFGTAGNTVCQGNDSRLSDARTPTAHTHDATDSYVGEIETPAVRTYTIDLAVATARTISALYFITSAGTVDVTLKNGANTVYTADGLGTTKTSVTSGLSNTSVSAGGSITLVLDAVSTPADLSFAIYYTRTTGAIT